MSSRVISSCVVPSFFIYFHLAAGVRAAMGYTVDNWPMYISTDPGLLAMVSEEEGERMQIWAGELIKGAEPWTIPPSITVDEAYDSERTLIARERIIAADPETMGAEPEFEAIDDGDIDETHFDHLVLLLN